MRRRSLAIVALCLVVAAGLGYLGWSYFNEPDSPSGGLWKVTMLDPDASSVAYWIIDVQNDRIQPVASADDSVKPDTIELLQNDAETLHFLVHVPMSAGPVTYDVVAHKPEGNSSADRLLGSVHQEDRQRQFIILERTRDRVLNRSKVLTNTPAAEEFQKARKSKDSSALEEVARKYPHEAVGAKALLELLPKTGTPEVAGDRAGRILAAVHPYGREMEGSVCLYMARTFMGTQALTPLALEYARKAEESMQPSDPPEARASVSRTVAFALRLNGKPQEAEAVFARAAALRQELIHVELVPTRQPGGRVPVVELFTGTECNPCVAADLAFDGLLHTFAAGDVVLLQYHLNIPGPDAFANSGTATRSQFYDVPGTPTGFLDGKSAGPLFGAAVQAQERYRALRQAIVEERKQPPEAKLTLTASRKDDDIDMTAEVSASSGAEVRLRFVLVEELAKYPAGNGQYEHHQVVRAFPGGMDGFPVTATSQKHTASVKVSQLRGFLHDELTARSLPSERQPLALEKLRVVALVQDNKDRHILQAAQVDLPER